MESKMECKGCEGRDKLIASLAQRIDELEQNRVNRLMKDALTTLDEKIDLFEKSLLDGHREADWEFNSHELSNAEFLVPPDMTHKLRSD